MKDRDRMKDRAIKIDREEILLSNFEWKKESKSGEMRGKLRPFVRERHADWDI